LKKNFRQAIFIKKEPLKYVERFFGSSLDQEWWSSQ